MFADLNNIDVLIIDWKKFKNKLLIIIGIIFFAGFSIGFGIGYGVENSLQKKMEIEISK